MSRIAVLSDSHDNVWNLDKVLTQVRASGAETLIHCGDLCAPFVVDRLGKGFDGPIHIVFGNNDGDGRLLHTIASQHAHVSLHAIYIELEIAERNIAVIHYPEPARRIAQSGHFDLVCYGHNHLKAQELIDDCWLANPGEILGLQAKPTWGIYDTVGHSFEIQNIE